MKGIEKEVIVRELYWYADDGKEFTSRSQCIKYENEVLHGVKPSYNNCVFGTMTKMKSCPHYDSDSIFPFNPAVCPCKHHTYDFIPCEIKRLK